MNPFFLVVLALAVFFVGRMYGIVEGQRRREERIERQRGIEVKHLLDHINLTWRK